MRTKPAPRRTRDDLSNARRSSGKFIRWRKKVTPTTAIRIVPGRYKGVVEAAISVPNSPDRVKAGARNQPCTGSPESRLSTRSTASST